MTWSLQDRLTLTYALFIGLALALLTVVINLCTGMIFTALVKDNINDRSTEIVRALGDQYRWESRSFNSSALEALGMYFVQEGYIITLEDRRGAVLWDAHTCNRERCGAVLRDIAERMEGQFGLKGALEYRRIPMIAQGEVVGTVTIETYGPFFYSETEARFLSSINQLLLIAGIFLTLISAGLSALLARTIARPIVQAGEAARRIAQPLVEGHLPVRIPDYYRTRELAELARSINWLAAELEEGERRQKRLTADIAHELRTPLTCLQGHIEAMIDGVWEPDRQRLESCHEEILRLSRLVEDLKTLAALEGEENCSGASCRAVPWELAAHLQKTHFDLTKLLLAVTDQFRPAAQEKGIALNLIISGTKTAETQGSAVPPSAPHPALPSYFITADYDRLKQVFINLLSNALKYTDQGSVTVQAEQEGVHWTISVADTGIGIAEGELPRIFERLYRSDKSRSRNTGGAGIGLTIAAAIAAAHGGTIGVESAVGRGTVFRVRVRKV